jgi:hypothetical protein
MGKMKSRKDKHTTCRLSGCFNQQCIDEAEEVLNCTNDGWLL